MTITAFRPAPSCAVIPRLLDSLNQRNSRWSAIPANVPRVIVALRAAFSAEGVSRKSAAGTMCALYLYIWTGGPHIRGRVPQVRPSVGLTWVSPTSWDGRVPHTSQVLACVGLLTFMLAHANAGATKSPVPLRGTAEESPAFQRWASTNRSHSSLPKACAQSPSRSAHNTIRSALFAPIRSRLVSTDN